MTKQVDKYLDAAFHHEAFMKSRCEIILGANKRSRDMVVGREDILKEVTIYAMLQLLALSSMFVLLVAESLIFTCQYHLNSYTCTICCRLD